MFSFRERILLVASLLLLVLSESTSSIPFLIPIMIPMSFTVEELEIVCYCYCCSVLLSLTSLLIRSSSSFTVLRTILFRLPSNFFVLLWNVIFIFIFYWFLFVVENFHSYWTLRNNIIHVIFWSLFLLIILLLLDPSNTKIYYNNILRIILYSFYYSISDTRHKTKFECPSLSLFSKSKFWIRFG